MVRGIWQSVVELAEATEALTSLAICVSGSVLIRVEAPVVIAVVPAIHRLTIATHAPPPEPTSSFVQLATEVEQSGGRDRSPFPSIESDNYK